MQDGNRVEVPANRARIANSWVEVTKIRVETAVMQEQDVRVNFSSFKGCCYLHGPSNRTAFVSIYTTPGYYDLSETPVLLKETPRFHANYDNQLTVTARSCRRTKDRREQVKELGKKICTRSEMAQDA
jgi:hypothetical protein